MGVSQRAGPSMIVEMSTPGISAEMSAPKPSRSTTTTQFIAMYTRMEPSALPHTMHAMAAMLKNSSRQTSDTPMRRAMAGTASGAPTETAMPMHARSAMTSGTAMSAKPHT